MGLRFRPKGEPLRVFLSGDQNPQFIMNGLEELHDKFHIDMLIGMADSPCMDVVIPWAQKYGIVVSLHLPSGDKIANRCFDNHTVILRDEPDIVIIYNEEGEVTEHLIELAQENPYVQYLFF